MKRKTKRMPIIQNLAYHPITPSLVRPTLAPQYTIDKNASRLVTELERIGFDVPGWDIIMSRYGSGDEQYVYVRMVEGHIAGAKFIIKLDRWSEEDTGKHFVDQCSLSAIGTPHADGLPPCVLRISKEPTHCRLDVYCGDKWEDDCVNFWNGTCEDTWEYVLNANFEFAQSQLSKSLEIPKLSALSGMTLESAMTHANRFLERVVDRVRVPPSRPITIKDLTLPDPDPLIKPAIAYALIDGGALARVSTHQKNIVLKPWARFALLPNRPILNPDLAVDLDLPRSAFIKYAWLSMWKPDPKDPENYALFRQGLIQQPKVMKATIRIANDAFVADAARADDHKKKLWAQRACLTDEDVKGAWAAVARSMVPLDAYQGGYRKPLLLLTRELRLDEVELL